MKRSTGPFAGIAALAAAALVASPVLAGDVPAADVPARTPWGDPDLRGTWPIQNIWDAGIPYETPDGAAPGELSDPEFAERLGAAERSDAAFSIEFGGGGSVGLADWLRSSALARRRSLVVDPPDGRLPPLTPQAEELYAQGRSTWQSSVTDWITDLDPFERCITRGFPAVMLPQPYNNGLRVFQSPGYVVLQMETFGARVIPLRGAEHWPDAVRAWHGDSRGHWDGDTLVIETTNIVSGDSVTTDASRRAAGPFPGRGHATQPVGPAARATERLTVTAPGTLSYSVTYDDPDVFEGPWTLLLDRTRDDSYAMFEYACHEGNTVRNAITSSRAQRREGPERTGE